MGTDSRTGVPVSDKERKRRGRLFLGLGVFAIGCMLPSPPGLPPAGKNLMLILFLNMYLLVTRVLPMGVVGLLPVILLPILGIIGPAVDAKTLKSAVLSYADDINWLVMAGFMIGGAMEKWNLHKRISYGIASTVGRSPSTILLGFVAATAFISMFLTNTATTVMMMPIAVAFLKATDIPPGNLFAAALVTGVSYGANIGGCGTPTGSSLSAAAVGLLPKLTNQLFTYADYLAVGVPFVVASVTCAWLVLRWLYKPDKAPGSERLNRQALVDAKKGLGPMTTAELHVALMLLVMLGGLVTRPLLWGKSMPFILDGTFLMILAVAMFFIPEKDGRMMYDWKDAAKDIDWGMLLLIGGGLTIAGLMGTTGVTNWLSGVLSGIKGVSTWTGVYMLDAITNFLCNFGVSMMAALPLAHAIAKGLGISIPLTLFVVCNVAQLNISLPNRPSSALSLSSGYADAGQLIKGGILISIANIIIAPIIAYFITMGIFRIGVGW